MHFFPLILPRLCNLFHYCFSNKCFKLPFFSFWNSLFTCSNWDWLFSELVAQLLLWDLLSLSRELPFPLPCVRSMFPRFHLLFSWLIPLVQQSTSPNSSLRYKSKNSFITKIQIHYIPSHSLEYNSKVKIIFPHHFDSLSSLSPDFQWHCWRG